MKNPQFSLGLKVALTYSLIGGLCILLTDKIIPLIFTNPSLLKIVQTYKDWLFIVVTTLLLFLLFANVTESKKQVEKSYSGLFDNPQSTHYLSPKLIELLGNIPEELMAGENIWENSLHPDDEERVLAEDIRTDLITKPLRVEYRLRKRDRNYAWMIEEDILLKAKMARHSTGKAY